MKIYFLLNLYIDIYIAYYKVHISAAYSLTRIRAGIHNVMLFLMFLSWIRLAWSILLPSLVVVLAWSWTHHVLIPEVRRVDSWCIQFWRWFIVCIRWMWLRNIIGDASHWRKAIRMRIYEWISTFNHLMQVLRSLLTICCCLILASLGRETSIILRERWWTIWIIWCLDIACIIFLLNFVAHGCVDARHLRSKLVSSMQALTHGRFISSNWPLCIHESTFLIELMLQILNWFMLSLDGVEANLILERSKILLGCFSA